MNMNWLYLIYFK